MHSCSMPPAHAMHSATSSLCHACSSPPPIPPSCSFYVVRVQGDKPSQHATASIRASCLAHSDVPMFERIGLLLNDEGSLMSLSYTLAGRDPNSCRASTTPQIPQTSSALIQKPRPGPSILSGLGALGGSGRGGGDAPHTFFQAPGASSPAV
jgi:hypothetical protein